MPFPLALAPVGAFLKRIPRFAWIALAVVALLALGTCHHRKAVKKFGDERYAAGVAHEAARIEAKAKKIQANAERISTKLREQNNEENRRISADARTIVLRGPGKAACVNAPAISPGRREQASGGTVPARPEVSSGERDALQELAAVPWPWLVDRAEQCDLNRAEALTWREWHKQLVADWEKQR